MICAIYVNVEKIEELNDKIAIHVKLPLGTHTCPNCDKPTKKVHDYRVQKVNHLKWFERLTVLFYKRRRYVLAVVNVFQSHHHLSIAINVFQKSGIR